jgi:ADP-ribose pyrophosphatase YjhB (NUDIX family)
LSGRYAVVKLLAMSEHSAKRRNPTGQHSGPSVWKVPTGDNRERLVCADCGFIHYENPKVVVGVVAVWNATVLMCRRAIEPRRGFWTLPGGYLEARESMADGAKREAWEEAEARIEITDLFAAYSVPRLSQVHLFFRARLLDDNVAAGIESLEARLFAWDNLPDADSIAFPTTRWALAHYREVSSAPHVSVRTNPPGDDGDMI